MPSRSRKKNTDNQQESTVTATAFDPRAIQTADADFEIKTTTTRDKYADNPFVKDVRASYDNQRAKMVEVPRSQVGEITTWLRDAAQKEKLGLAIRYRYNTIDDNGQDSHAVVGLLKDLPADENDYPVTIGFTGKEPRKTQEKDAAKCPYCDKTITVNADGKLRGHKNKDNSAQCQGTGLQTETADEDENQDDNQDVSTDADA